MYVRVCAVSLSNPFAASLCRIAFVSSRFVGHLFSDFSCCALHFSVILGTTWRCSSTTHCASHFLFQLCVFRHISHHQSSCDTRDSLNPVILSSHVVPVLIVVQCIICSVVWLHYSVFIGFSPDERCYTAKPFDILFI